METLSTPSINKSDAYGLSLAEQANVTLYPFSKKNPISCIIRLPAADDVGSGHTRPMINTRNGMSIRLTTHQGFDLTFHRIGYNILQ